MTGKYLKTNAKHLKPKFVDFYAFKRSIKLVTGLMVVVKLYAHELKIVLLPPEMEVYDYDL